MPKDALPVRRHTVTVKVQFRKGADADQAFRALDALAGNPSALTSLVKAALAETVVRAFRERFKRSESDMSTMHAVDRASESRRERELDRKLPPASSAERREKLLRRAEEIRDLVGEGRSLSADLLDELTKISEALEDQTPEERRPDRRKGKDFFKNVLYRGGKGRELLLQGMAEVLELVAGGRAMRVHHQGNRSVVGVGNIAALEAIRTPSYTEYERGHVTHSLYTTLWRQLEFGTGYYARPARVKTWWRYSGSIPDIRGSKGGHFLRDATGVPYQADAVRFEGVFHEKLVRALSGR